MSNVEIHPVHAVNTSPVPLPPPVPQAPPAPITTASAAVDYDVVVALHPVQIVDGYPAEPQNIENEGGGYAIYTGYSVHQGATYRTIAYGALLTMEPGSTTETFDESGAGGEIILETGGVEIWGEPEGDFSGLTRVARGAIIRMTRGSTDPNPELDSGGCLTLEAGEVFRSEDPGSTGGGKINIYGAHGRQQGYVRIDAGYQAGHSSHGLEISEKFVEVIGDTFSIGQPWHCTGPDAEGSAGNIRWDENFLYLKAKYNQWKRIPLKAFAQEIENFGDEFRMGDAFIRFVHMENGFPIQPRIQIGVGNAVALEFMAGDDPWVQGFQTPVRINSPFWRVTTAFTVPTPDAPGANGSFCADQDYLYHCYADNQWGRVAWEKNWPAA